VGPYRFLLIYPGVPLFTKDIYENLNLVLTKGKKNFTVVVDILKSGRPEGINEVLFNRLQEAAFRTSPHLEQSWNRLNRLGLGTFTISGSGSTLFRILEDSDPIPNLADVPQGEHAAQMYVVRSSAAIRR
jgi:4-diphosphocytidyl-2C-methyl-D-erythritol kinase